MVLTASALCQNIYKLLDRVLETGVPLKVERNGRGLQIIACEPPPKLGVRGRVEATAYAIRHGLVTST